MPTSSTVFRYLHSSATGDRATRGGRTCREAVISSPACSGSLTSGPNSAELAFTSSRRSNVAMLATNSPVCSAFRCESFRVALEKMTTGGWLDTRLKKLYGARLTTPAGLSVEIQPIGRGTTSAVYGLWARLWGSVRGSKYIARMSFRGILPGAERRRQAGEHGQPTGVKCALAGRRNHNHETALVAPFSVRPQGHGIRARNRPRRSPHARPHGRGHVQTEPRAAARPPPRQDPDAGHRRGWGAVRVGRHLRVPGQPARRTEAVSVVRAAALARAAVARARRRHARHADPLVQRAPEAAGAADAGVARELRAEDPDVARRARARGGRDRARADRHRPRRARLRARLSRLPLLRPALARCPPARRSVVRRLRAAAVDAGDPAGRGIVDRVRRRQRPGGRAWSRAGSAARTAPGARREAGGRSPRRARSAQRGGPCRASLGCAGGLRG